MMKRNDYIKMYKILLSLLIIVLISKVTIASVISYQQLPQGVQFKLDRGLMQLNICQPSVIEVKYTVLDSFPSKPSLVVNNKWTKKYSFFVKDSEGKIVITTSELKIIVNKQSEAISYYTINGQLITSETADSGKVMMPQQIAGINTYGCSTAFKSPGDEGLFGLGCHPEDSLSINYKGRNQEMLIRYMTGAIPVLLSTKGFGLMWDNYSASNFFGAEDNNTQFKYVSESGKQIDYYFFYGPDFDHIINLYRTATGKAPMFPKWAFGLFQSQDRYKSQDEILSVMHNYRNNHIPVDAIVQDWYYWEPLPIGSHIMNPSKYPNPKSMLDSLHNEHIHGMISIWPVFGKGTDNYAALQKIHGLTDITWDNIVTHTFDNYYDVYNPAARQLYWQQARDSLIKRYDWDAWWVDQCEPDNGSLLDARRTTDFYIGKGIDYFNTYSLEHSEGLYEGWRKDIPGKRAFFLIRQSFAGEQRNAAALWSSDITCTFESFKRQIPQAINACVSGIPYWTSDIGGYHLNWSAPDWSKPENRELFTRWFQFGTFSPIFRIHGKGERALFSNNWDSSTKHILLTYDKFRYRLLPYIYSLAGAVTQDNYTILRSLAFDFRDDKNVYGIPDQYMFGPAFMVCPVTSQLYTGDHVSSDKSREVYFPKGAEWYDFYTGKKYAGDQKMRVPAPIDIIPLFVKAGSIIPMGPEMEYSTQKPDDTLELRIYPGANGIFKYYSDAGNNYNYEKGEFSTFIIRWNDATRTLSFSDIKGDFPDMLKQRHIKIILVGEKNGIGFNDESDIEKNIVYTGKAISVRRILKN